MSVERQSVPVLSFSPASACRANDSAAFGAFNSGFFQLLSRDGEEPGLLVNTRTK